ncbi:hypothetical protein CRENBAI_015858 [Crenichthys baileyi]|uniref:Uncharacterized protein n=1 Tax=Crenichthys baileyi TaxID=28760 RepID=A0AAV9R7T2_9TELE
MGQNQDKTEGGEQVLDEELEETKLCRDFGGLDTQSGEITEGEDSCEEENGKKSDEPECYHLNESPSYEPTITSIETHIQLYESQYAAREVRQGGAAEKEGGGEQGGGGWTSPLSPHETEKNLKSTSGTHRLKTTHKLSKINKNKRKTVEQLQVSTKIRMEHQAEETSPQKHDSSEDACSFGHSEQDSMMLKPCTYGTHRGSESLLVQDLNEIMMAEAGNEDIKLRTETVGYLTERKEPPPVQDPHPLENSLQKESFLHMSDTIQGGTPKEKTKMNGKEVTPKHGLGDSSARQKVTDVCMYDLETEMQHSHPDTAEANEAIASESAPNAALHSEPSSILEKLLKRNKTEATPSLAKIKDVYIDTTEDLVDAEMILNSTSAAATALNNRSNQPEGDTQITQSKQPEPNPPSKDSHNEIRDVEQTVVAQRSTSVSPCFQSAASGNATCESLLTESHYPRDKNIYSTDDSVKADAKIRSNTGLSESMSSNGSQSAVSHETTSCELSGVIVEQSKPSSAESTPRESGGQIANSSQILDVDKTDSDIIGKPSSIKSETSNKTSGSDGADALSGGRRVVKQGPEDATAPPVDTCAPLVLDGLVITQESSQITTSTQLDLQSLNSEHAQAEGTDVKHFSERDSVSMRDKSQCSPKPRPVSDLIKETIQLHEKLQHHDRPKPAEVKSADDQAQSVKVAQMKAAFDSAQKFPDKAVERKPSVRRGSGFD